MAALLVVQTKYVTVSSQFYQLNFSLFGTIFRYFYLIPNRTDEIRARIFCVWTSFISRSSTIFYRNCLTVPRLIKLSCKTSRPSSTKQTRCWLLFCSFKSLVFLIIFPNRESNSRLKRHQKTVHIIRGRFHFVKAPKVVTSWTR